MEKVIHLAGIPCLHPKKSKPVAFSYAYNIKEVTCKRCLSQKPK
ncbi:hypothetical protein [Pedobacter panaciterrae]